MQKRAPTLGNILVIILFVLSCFGLLMFLWESFGGPLPLKPRGYRFTVAFPRTLALSEQSDVRISGVNVGRVVSVNLGNDGRTHANIEIASRYAPLRASMHAILRQKSLLGETYVQLIPEGRGGPPLRDGSQLPNTQVERSVTLDDILSAFDARTRREFQVWMQDVRPAIEGRGEGINASFAQLEPFAENGNKLVTILAEQEGAVRALIHNTGVVFNALASRDHQLEGLIVNGERTFKAAAESSQSFAEAFRALPTFERRSRIALKELDAFASVASPYLDEFRPTERKLSALLTAAKPFVPEFNGFLTSLGPLTRAARTGLPELRKILNLTTPVLEEIRPVLHNFDPFLQYTGAYVPEVQSFFANITAAAESQAGNNNVSGGPKQHLLTTLSVLNPESLAFYPSKIGTERSNPYLLPGAFHSLVSGLPTFDSRSCANSSVSVNGPPNTTISKEVIEQLIGFHVANAPENPEGIEAKSAPGSPNSVAAPPCIQQGPFSFNGSSSLFPHVSASAK
jgi:phospholipid/cholesterol/gamma-HCH transport system substrate-binding protein